MSMKMSGVGEHATDGGGGEGKGGGAVVAPEGIELPFDDLADGGAVGRRGPAGVLGPGAGGGENAEHHRQNHNAGQ